MYLKMIIFIKKGVPKSIEPVGRANSRLYKEELAKLINENINIDPAQTRSNLESFSISPDEESEIDENLDLNLKNPQLLNPPNADDDINADYQPQTLTPSNKPSGAGMNPSNLQLLNPPNTDDDINADYQPQTLTPSNKPSGAGMNPSNLQLLNPPAADEEDIRADYQPQTLTSQPTPEQSPETRADADKSLHDKQFREADSVYFSEPADADVSLQDDEFRNADKIPSSGLSGADVFLRNKLSGKDIREYIDAAIQDGSNRFQ